MFVSLLTAFLLTAAAEGAIVYALFRNMQFVYYSLLWNLLTNPALNLIVLIAVSTGGEAAYLPAAIIGELCVFFIEALLIRFLLNLSLGKALLLSLLLNAASYTAGLLAAL